MYAHRQIYDHVQDSVPVPESMRNQRVEVIFIGLDEPAPQHSGTGGNDRFAGQAAPPSPATGLALIQVMRASPCPEWELTSATGVQGPVRDVAL